MPLHDERFRRLLDAVLVVGSGLELRSVLTRLVESARDLVDARYGALGVIDEAGKGLSEFITVGIDEDGIAAIGHYPHGLGILGVLIVDPKPLRLHEIGEHADSYGFPPNHPPMDTFLGVPVRIRAQVFGNLYLTDKAGGADFTQQDEDLVVALAGAAGIAIENARLHARVRELALLEDRERIARDLHDTVIQRLFATGLSLEAAARLVRDRPDVADRLSRSVDDLDETIRGIRSAIFALERPRDAGSSVRGDVLSLATESAATLGFEPHVRLDGPIDTSVDGLVAEHLLATLREALSNVARHAAASRVDVWLGVAGGRLTLEVVDDGTGIEGAARVEGKGLVNMRDRARSVGGELVVERRDEGGTRLVWSAPLN